MKFVINTASLFHGSSIQHHLRTLIAIGTCTIFFAVADAIAVHDTGPNKNAGVTFGGSLRLRYENKANFKFDKSIVGNKEDYGLSQLRLNLKWILSESVTFYIEGQDSRIFDHSSINEQATPTVFADDFDLHQGYIDWRTSADHNTNVRIGRQKFNLGSNRLVASLEWVNTARVWDGVRLTMGDSNERKIDLITSRLVAVNKGNFNDWEKTNSRYFNSDFHIAYLTDRTLIPNTQLEGYYMLRNEDRVNDEVHTIGSRFETIKGNWQFNGEFAGQFGDFGGLSHTGYAVHIEGGYTFATLNNSHLGIAYNFASGDSDPTDSDHETFDNLYPLNHAYYGYMDLFSWQNVHNFETAIKTKLFDKLSVRIAFQSFWLAKEDTDSWYNAGLGSVRNAAAIGPTGVNADSYVGTEIDLTVSYPITSSITSVLGYSHFFSGAYISDTSKALGQDDKDADFVFIQVKLSF